MIRLHITTEGATELNFVRQVLARHLGDFNIVADARSVLTSKDNRLSREFRGGLVSYQKARQDILNWIKEDNHPECRFTSMFDLYALPQDFPGYAEAQAQRDAYQQVEILEAHLKQDIGEERFIPYIQLHEFEALILADPQQLGEEYLEHDQAIDNLISMVGDKNPELINNGPETAPSKRILNEIPEYDKATAGPAVTKRIVIPKLRERCRHFHEWLSTLEQLNGVTHE